MDFDLRVVTFVFVILLCMTISGSKEARAKITTVLATNKLLSYCVFGFIATLFLSICTSADRNQSISFLSDSCLNWFVPLVACIFLIRSRGDMRILCKFVVASSIVVGSSDTPNSPCSIDSCFTFFREACLHR